MKQKRSSYNDAASMSPAPPLKRMCKMAPTLTDLPGELVVSILSYMDFYERIRVRRVCSGLSGAVDSMPAQPNMALKIRLFTPASDVDSEAGQCGSLPNLGLGEGKPGSLPLPSWSITRSKNFTVILTFNRYEEDIDQLLSSLPMLKTVRPASLVVESSMEDGEVLDARLLHHLATEVGSTVKHLSIIGLATPPSLAASHTLLQAFSKFEEKGCVKKLSLECLCPLATVVSAATCLRNLENLRLVLRKEIVLDRRNHPERVGLPLADLSTLPNLRTLSLLHSRDDEISMLDRHTYTSVATSLFRGISAIPKLEELTCNLLFDWDGSNKDIIHESFATMLHFLHNLEELRFAFCPSFQLWRQVHAAGGRPGLRKLTVWCTNTEFRREKLEALVTACIQDFPLLTELTLRPRRSLSLPNASLTKPVLSRLRDHPSLSAVNIRLRTHSASLGQALLTLFREVLGEKITVTAV